jgi:hypothetical protein
MDEDMPDVIETAAPEESPSIDDVTAALEEVQAPGEGGEAPPEPLEPVDAAEELSAPTEMPATSVPPPVVTPPMVGRVKFEDVNGTPDGSAIYTVHPSLRERTLVWGGIARDQNRMEDGVWVYRATPTSGRGHAAERDPFLQDDRG